MKIAIVHDYIKEYGGAERVLEALHETWPDAPIFTTVYLPQFLGPHKERFAGWDIRTSIFQYVPFKEKLISPLRIIAPLLFRLFDFSEFDVVIVSATGAYSPNGIKIKNQKSKIKNAAQICYCHTPPRYLYGFATAREWKNNIFFRILGSIANHFLRIIDFKSAQNVDYFIANSKNVAERIKKFYRREATVIYPPVDTAFSSSAFSVQLKNKKLDANLLDARRYFVAGGRLARPKHIDLIVETCDALNLRLKIFGKDFADYGDELRSKVKSQKSKVEFLGEVTDKKKLELMAKAKAYIFASEDEDFGITPVEAMSMGIPVIAYRSGGVLESVLENPSASSGSATGLFFDNLSVESLSKAIKEFEKIKFNRELISEYARKFSKERFKREIQLFVGRGYKKNS